jgi:RNA polymerase sigma factor (sigma-70 family)
MRGPDLRRLYDGHAQALYVFLLNLTRDEADTRDLLQDIFVKLARDPDLLAGVRDERAFLIRLAHNAAIDLIRRRGTRDKTREQFAAEIISPFASTSDPDEQTFRAVLAEALDALAPQFIAKLQHDIINGRPLHYRRISDGQFVLYSVGWNETDDGGEVAFTKGGSLDVNTGDWVWRYPSK